MKTNVSGIRFRISQVKNGNFPPPSAKFCSAPPPVPEGGTEQLTSTGARYGKVCPEATDMGISVGTCPEVRRVASIFSSLHLPTD